VRLSIKTNNNLANMLTKLAVLTILGNEYAQWEIAFVIS